jgi:histidine ammonia-lyase
MASALKFRQVVRNTRSVLAIEALAAARALDLLAPLKTGAALEEARARIRKVSPAIEGDRPFYRDIEAIAGLIAAGALQLE